MEFGFRNDSLIISKVAFDEQQQISDPGNWQESKVAVRDGEVRCPAGFSTLPYWWSFFDWLRAVRQSQDARSWFVDSAVAVRFFGPVECVAPEARNSNMKGQVANDQHNTSMYYNSR